MSACNCSTRYAEDGVINRSTITNSQITNTTVQASDLVSCSIKDLATIDAASAKTIADAIAQLEPAQLAALVNAIQECLSPVDGEEPTALEGPEIPSTIVGTRDQLLGRPDGWAKLGSYSIPMYH
jgi:hypothetical protein